MYLCVSNWIIMDQDVFTVDEAAEYLRVSRPTVYRWMRDGQLPFYVLPKGGRRLKKQDLEQLLKPGAVEDLAGDDDDQ